MQQNHYNCNYSNNKADIAKLSEFKSNYKMSMKIKEQYRNSRAIHKWLHKIISYTSNNASERRKRKTIPNKSDIPSFKNDFNKNVKKTTEKLPLWMCLRIVTVKKYKIRD